MLMFAIQRVCLFGAYLKGVLLNWFYAASAARNMRRVSPGYLGCNSRFSTVAPPSSRPGSSLITLNQEHKLCLVFAPDYDHLPLIAKVEVFDYALQNTEGNDLSRVGYLLGLGDRHPSNLMLHRFSGKILHIDFGDCFEASMNREKFPEKVPFRLTRMLVKAMEVSGIEGNFRSTCESVMQVLRTHKDSVMAMMEAFVHDPLINWRLFNFNEVPQMSTLASTHTQPAVNGEESVANREMLQPQRGVRERELLQVCFDSLHLSCLLAMLTSPDVKPNCFIGCKPIG
ncbi:hypothetical protein SASPL_132092 [Salvia splendens]|uniref:PI3K/PI4K catalytic domain-containing protein n=1 Tax=Salvia splendens TaxID=180675 RepID=A0A8X8ZLH3_SALSN|nr:hypothetical protein SASPL_132092 [Salvia splendens]